MPDTSPNPSPEPIFSVVARIIGAVGPMFSGLISATLFAYVVGWIEARAYFGEFGATWLVEQLPREQVLTFSILPLLTIGYMVWETIRAAAERQTGDAPKARPGIDWFFRRGWIVIMLLYLASGVADYLEYFQLAYMLAFATVVMVSFDIAIVFERILLLVQHGRFLDDASNAYLMYFIVFFGIYFVPSVAGHAQAHIDNRPTTTSLPTVHLKSSTVESLHLLAIVGPTVYAVLLDGEHNEEKSVRILPLSEVFAIEQPQRGQASTPTPTR